VYVHKQPWVSGYIYKISFPGAGYVPMYKLDLDHTNTVPDEKTKDYYNIELEHYYRSTNSLKNALKALLVVQAFLKAKLASTNNSGTTLVKTCAICQEKMYRNDLVDPKKVFFTRCCHAFHLECFQGFERHCLRTYNHGQAVKCPTCKYVLGHVRFSRQRT